MYYALICEKIYIKNERNDNGTKEQKDEKKKV